MVNDRSLGQALLQSTGATIGHGFRSALPRPDDEQERRYLQTTHRAAFGTPSTLAPYHRQRHQLSPAGGAGGQQIERGRSTSGAMGEVFRTSTEPQKDTSSQRSWLYSLDPMIATKKNTPLIDGSEGGISMGANLPIPRDFRRKSTSITNIPLGHQGVFADD